MPTAVATARQCLTEEAARALDEAVSVAKRRNHAQTTSLHAISALLSPSITLLRDSLTRCRSSAYSPRLQFRALELCVGVSLDRLPSSKTTPSENDDFAPPISNSLMAAIKRSQANQRRQPEMYHFHQFHVSNSTNNNNNFNNNSNSNNISISSIKVELKHFVLSILDDPIVSRVFGDAGFRSSEIKLAIIQPPRWVGPSPGNSARCPPLFLCNLMDFQGYFGDENCKRIGEVMVKNNERNNPLLLGVCAKDALSKFKDCILNQKPNGLGVGPGIGPGVGPGLPVGVQGSKLICLENEIKEFIINGEEKGLDSKIEEVKLMVVEKNEGSSSGSGSSGGVVVNIGELNVLVEDKNDEEKIEKVVKKLSEFLSKGGEKRKIWVIGCSENYEIYSKFVGKFPNVECDWDLHPLPITSTTSRSSFDGFGSKSSLMGSFVPFGGFFPTPSDYRPPLASVRPPFTRCNSCNEKYQHELSATLREGSSLPVGDQQLPSWLPRSESDSSMGGDVIAQVKDVKSPSKETIRHLQEKWDDHCRQAHQTSMFVAPGFSLARLQVPQSLGFPFMVDNVQGSSSSGDSSLNERVCSSSSSGMMIMAQNLSPQPQASKAVFSKQALEVSQCLPNQTTAISVTVTTDLGLGTIYGSKVDIKKPLFQNHQVHSQKFSAPGPISTNQGFLGKKDYVQSSSEGLDPCDYKSLFRKLSEAVSWQTEAIRKIVEVVSCCRSGMGRQRGGNVRGNIWLNFLGPDKIGKKRIAEELANAMFGSKDRLIAVDLSSQDRFSNVDSIFVCQGSYSYNINTSRTTVVDHIAQELCKKPHSVVFLEHVDEADLVVQNSLSHAIQTGKFRDSRGKEVGINNVVFLTSSTVTKDERSISPRKEFIKFQEEQILEAKNWQMQLAIRRAPMDVGSRFNETSISLLPTKCASNQESSAKRKLSNILSDASDQLAKRGQKTPKSSLDLNLPLEDEEASDDQMDIFGRAWLEEFFAQVDGNVEFKSFNFDALADKLMRKMRSKFEETYKGERISLEIDHEVMVQILAASWSSNKEATEHWIEQVLCTSFATAREKYHISSESIVRLNSCVGIPVREWASEICLPKSINLGI